MKKRWGIFLVSLLVVFVVVSVVFFTNNVRFSPKDVEQKTMPVQDQTKIPSKDVSSSGDFLYSKGDLFSQGEISKTKPKESVDTLQENGFFVELPRSSVIEYYESLQKEKMEQNQKEILIAKYKKGLTAEHSAFLQSLSRKPTVLQNYYLGFNGLLVKDDSMVIHEILKVPGVKIYPNRIKKAQLMDSVPLVRADQTWSSGYTGSGVKIAVLDTGVNYHMADFGSCTTFQNCQKFVGGYDFVNNDNDPMDDHGHGTHVAGIVASNGPLKGVAPGAKLGIYKILDSYGSGWDSDIISAIEDALDPNQDGNFDDKYDIISMSIGGSGTPDDPLSQEVDKANALGTLVVVAAGNSGPGNIDCPGCARGAFTVGATDKQDQIAYFSGTGPYYYGNELILKPDIVAPGVSICSANAYPSYPSDCFDENHIFLRGTSMATPHVAGAAALIKNNYGWEYGPEDFKSLLAQTARDIGYDVFMQGGGRLDAYSPLGIQAYIRPNMLDWGIVTPSDSIKQFNFTAWSTDYGYADSGAITKKVIIKNIDTNESFEFANTERQICLDKNIRNKTVYYNISFSGLPMGRYSGYMIVDLYNSCNFSQSYSQSIRVPVAFAKMYPLKVNFIGTPPNQTSYYVYHDNYFAFVGSDGQSINRKEYSEYGSQNQYTYSVYSIDRDVDFVAFMIENSFYPSYDHLNVNYFVDHLDLNITNNITLNETIALHVQQNLADVALGKNLEIFGFKTELLKKSDYYSDLLYYFLPEIGLDSIKHIDFGISALNPSGLFNQDLMIYLSVHAKDVGLDFETTKDYMVLPLTINYPYTDLEKQINFTGIKSIPLQIPETLTNYLDSHLYFGVNSYSPLNYWSDANPQKINTPRNGTFYYLDNCEECYYHYELYVNDETKNDNYYVFSNYFDGPAKYIPETTGVKPTKVSLFEEPLSLNISTTHCVQYGPGNFYFCNDSLLRGFIQDSFGAQSLMTTEGVSGSLSIKTPSGEIYSILSGDNQTLAFGRFGSWIIDCSVPSLSYPPILKNSSAFCQEGNYTLNWTLKSFIENQTLSLNATVSYDESRGFSIVNPSLQSCEPQYQCRNDGCGQDTVHEGDAWCRQKHGQNYQCCVRTAPMTCSELGGVCIPNQCGSAELGTGDTCADEGLSGYSCCQQISCASLGGYCSTGGCSASYISEGNADCSQQQSEFCCAGARKVTKKIIQATRNDNAVALGPETEESLWNRFIGWVAGLFR